MREQIKTALGRLGSDRPAAGATLLIHHRVGGGSPDELDLTIEFLRARGRSPARCRRRLDRCGPGQTRIWGRPAQLRADVRRRFRRRARPRLAPAEGPQPPVHDLLGQRLRRGSDEVGGIDREGGGCPWPDVGPAWRDGRVWPVHRRQPHPLPRASGGARRGRARRLHRGRREAPRGDPAALHLSVGGARPSHGAGAALKVPECQHGRTRSQCAWRRSHADCAGCRSDAATRRHSSRQS